MLLLVGLGNPGPRHENNRHNVGFMAVDAIVRRHSFGMERTRFQALVAEGVIAGRKTMAMKPTTFMNESGRAVGEAVRFFKLAPEQVVVIYDEVDLALGKVRTKQGGGHAGHNGVRNIIQHIGPDFWRVRVGIGHPGDKEKVHGHVLGDFSKADQPMVDKIVDAIADAAPLIAVEDFNAFMTKVMQQVHPQRPKPPKPETPDGTDRTGDG